jgi:hypothetical protein
MKPTRRGFLGIMTGAAAATVVPLKSLLAEEVAEIEKVAKVVQPVAPTFKIDMDTGPPFLPGDVVRVQSTNRLYLVKKPEAEKLKAVYKGLGRSSYLTVKPADPGYVPRRKRRGPPELVLVPLQYLDSPICIPLNMLKPNDIHRVGRAYNEGSELP